MINCRGDAMKYDEKRSAKALGFLEAYAVLCQQHGLCLSHEDRNGGFLIHDLNADDMVWVKQADYERS